MKYKFNDNVAKDDFLGYEVYAESFRYIIENANDIIEAPVVFGIHGRWGLGKSTFMEMIKNKLNKDKNIILEINPWEYEENTDFIVVFFALLYNNIIAVKDSVEFMNKCNKLLKPLLRSIKFTMKSPITDMSMDFSKLLPEQQKDIMRDVINNKYLRKEAINDILSDETLKNKRIVVFIDDLDRCSVDKIVHVIESIKLFLGYSNCIFFMGCDMEYLKSAISIHYKDYLIEGSNEIGISSKDKVDEFSKEYLEKVIQVPFYIPKIDKENINSFILKTLSGKRKIDKPIYSVDINENEFDLNIKLLSEVFFYYNAPPRKMKRIISTIYLKFVILKHKNLENVDFDILTLMTLLEEFENDIFNKFVEDISNGVGLNKIIKKYLNSTNDKIKCIDIFVENKGIGKDDDFSLGSNIDEYIFIKEVVDDECAVELNSDYEGGMSYRSLYDLISHSDNLKKSVDWLLTEWFDKEIMKLDIQNSYVKINSIEDEFIFKAKIDDCKDKIIISFKEGRERSIVTSSNINIDTEYDIFDIKDILNDIKNVELRGKNEKTN